MANAEVPIPSAVLIKASEIPVDKATASGAPELASAENALIIPITVPKRATNVPIEPIVERIGMLRSKIGISRAVDSSISC